MNNKVIFNLQDASFLPDDSICKGRTPSLIEWNRGRNIADRPTVFTDMCLTLAKHTKTPYKIALLVEPEVINPQAYQDIITHQNDFDLILTHHQSLLQNPKANVFKFAYYRLGTSWIKDSDINSGFNKNKNISLIASEKNWTVGHQFRHEVARQFGPFIDLYGRAYRPIEDKIEALRDYRFSISIENCQANGYFTEKLMDCFLTKTVPIYMGGDFGEMFNELGVIKINNINDVGNVISELQDEEKAKKLYNSMAAYIDNNFEIAKHYIIPEDWIYNNILKKKGL